VLKPRNWVDPTTEDGFHCGIDSTIDSSRLLAEINGPYIFKFLDKTKDPTPGYKTRVFDIVGFDSSNQSVELFEDLPCAGSLEGQSGLLSMFLAPPKQQCNTLSFEDAQHEQSKYLPVFVASSGNMTDSVQRFITEIAKFKPAFDDNFPKLCGTWLEMKNETATSRVKELTFLFNFFLNGAERKFEPTKWRICKSKEETITSIDQTDVFDSAGSIQFKEQTQTIYESNKFGMIKMVRATGLEKKAVGFVESEFSVGGGGCVPASAEDLVPLSNAVVFEENESEVEIAVRVKEDQEEDDNECFVVKVKTGQDMAGKGRRRKKRTTGNQLLVKTERVAPKPKRNQCKKADHSKCGGEKANTETSSAYPYCPKENPDEKIRKQKKNANYDCVECLTATDKKGPNYGSLVQYNWAKMGNRVDCLTAEKSTCRSYECSPCTSHAECSHIAGKTSCSSTSTAKCDVCDPNSNHGCYEEEPHCLEKDDTKCVECKVNNDCKKSVQKSQCVDNACIACTTHDHCTQFTKKGLTKCLKTANKEGFCAECTADGDCKKVTHTCIQGKCTENCKKDSECYDASDKTIDKGFHSCQATKCGFKALFECKLYWWQNKDAKSTFPPGPGVIVTAYPHGGGQTMDKKPRQCHFHLERKSGGYKYVTESCPYKKGVTINRGDKARAQIMTKADTVCKNADVTFGQNIAWEEPLFKEKTTTKTAAIQVDAQDHLSFVKAA